MGEKAEKLKVLLDELERELCDLQSYSVPPIRSCNDEFFEQKFEELKKALEENCQGKYKELLTFKPGEAPLFAKIDIPKSPHALPFPKPEDTYNQILKDFGVPEDISKCDKVYPDLLTETEDGDLADGVEIQDIVSVIQHGYNKSWVDRTVPKFIEILKEIDATIAQLQLHKNVILALDKFSINGKPTHFQQVGIRIKEILEKQGTKEKKNV